MRVILCLFLLLSAVSVAHEGYPIHGVMGVDHGTRTPSPDFDSRLGQKDDDPIPCSGGACPPIEVPYEEPTPLPVPYEEPTLPPDDPFNPDDEWEGPEDNTTPVPVTCEQWIEAQREIDGWATWSYVNWNFYHGNPHGTEPDDGGWTTGFMVEPEWQDPPPSCNEMLTPDAFMWLDGIVKEDIYVHCEFAKVTLHPTGQWPPKYHYGVVLGACEPNYRHGQ